MIADGAQLLRVSEHLLESQYLLVTAHGDVATVGPESNHYAEYSSIETVRIGNERFQFDYEFDPSGPSPFGCVPLYVPDTFVTPEAVGFKATSIEEGMNKIQNVNLCGQE